MNCDYLFIEFNHDNNKRITNKISYEELIEIFLRDTIIDLKNEIETPNIHFTFNNTYQLFNKIANNIKKDNDIKIINKNIDYLFNHDDNCLTINVNNSEKFFNYLTEITNETINLSRIYGEKITNPVLIARYLLRRIWLRLGVSDVENIDYFLDKQLQFIKNTTLDSIDDIIVDSFYEYDIYMRTKVNSLWDESTRSMVFTIYKNEFFYELPHILYDIDNNNTCYIYGVQSSQNEKNKHIERKLYTLNKDIENPNVHPSKVYSLLLFINELKKKGISRISVPTLQVLSYHYHELLSKEAKKNYEGIRAIYKFNSHIDEIRDRYEYYKTWYEHVYQKEDKISYLKTEELINLIYRLTLHDKDIEIISDIDISENINIKIK